MVQDSSASVGESRALGVEGVQHTVSAAAVGGAAVEQLRSCF